MKALIVSITAAVLFLGTIVAQAGTGNGTPGGAHYNLNILGKTDCTPADLTGSERHTIQVYLVGGDKASELNGTLASALSKKNKIFLVPSEDTVYADSDFHVIDGNACDGAIFALPRAVATTWTVWARAGGKPDGTATITTCATDPVTQEIVCSTENVVLLREKGQKPFVDVTDELTSICLANDPVTGDCTQRIPLFDAALQDYFWNYDNNGLKLAQLRFYPVVLP